MRHSKRSNPNWLLHLSCLKSHSYIYHCSRIAAILRSCCRVWHPMHPAHQIEAVSKMRLRNQNVCRSFILFHVTIRFSLFDLRWKRICRIKNKWHFGFVFRRSFSFFFCTRDSPDFRLVQKYKLQVQSRQRCVHCGLCTVRWPTVATQQKRFKSKILPDDTTHGALFSIVVRKIVHDARG